MQPGEYLLSQEDIVLNAGRATVRLSVLAYLAAGILLLFTSWPGPLAAILARQRERYHAKLWEIALVRWQNTLEPLASQLLAQLLLVPLDHQEVVAAGGDDAFGGRRLSGGRFGNRYFPTRNCYRAVEIDD